MKTDKTLAERYLKFRLKTNLAAHPTLIRMYNSWVAPGFIV